MKNLLEQIVRKIISENADKVPQSIKNRVDILSQLISKAVDSDGDKIPVNDGDGGSIDFETIYEIPTINNNVLSIVSYPVYKQNEKSIDDFDFNMNYKEEDYWIMQDAMQTLNKLIRLYTNANNRNK